MTTFLYVANLIGYLRVACLLLAALFSESATTFIYFYVASYALDALDGPVARALDGTSRLGAVLDMVTDRASTAVLLALLQEPQWMIALILDISAHWFHSAASMALGESTHKEPKDAILKWYYKRTNLFMVCFMSEAFLCGCFLIKRGVAVPVELLMTAAPAFILKQAISLVHLVRGSQTLAAINQDDPKNKAEEND